VIHEVIIAFYDRIRQDAVLGPVFNEIVGDNWDAHLEKVCAFWRCVTRIDRSYSARNFMPAHLKRLQIQAWLLPRWLCCFGRRRARCVRTKVAEQLIDIAERMAMSVEISLKGAPPT
jgi:hemoglobin